MTPLDAAIVRRAGEGEYIPRDRPILVKASGPETGGAYSLLECTTPAGGWTTRHIHHTCEEAWYLLEGELTFQVGDRTDTYLPGTYVLVPRNVAHAFGNTGLAPAKSLILFSPPGMEKCFAEVAALAQASPTGNPDPNVLEAILSRYGQEIVERGSARPW
jgi:quercetin dioxygenase-like cupin family protein